MTVITYLEFELVLKEVAVSIRREISWRASMNSIHQASFLFSSRGNPGCEYWQNDLTFKIPFYWGAYKTLNLTRLRRLVEGGNFAVSILSDI
jgi:hypothetical protein